MRTEPAQRVPPAPGRRLQEPAHDVREGRPFLLARGQLRDAARRGLSILALVGLDVSGLALGLYAALVVRELVYGHDNILWGLIWEGPREWLPFLAPITVLVFWQSGLYATRERRAGPGKVVSSTALVAVVVLAFGLGTGYDFTTYGLIPTAAATCALTIGLLRTAYESATLELLRLGGLRRRVLLAGGRESTDKLRRTLGTKRNGVEYDFLGAVDVVADLPAVLAERRPDELILAEGDFDEAAVLEVVHSAHRYGVKVRLAPRTTELLHQRGEYVPGQGVPLFELRPPVLAGADWALKRGFDLAVSGLVVVVGLPVWLLVAVAIKLDSRGPVFYVDRRVGVGEREFPMFKFRTMVAGADQLQPELERSNEAEGALFKIRADPRVTRVGRVLRRLSVDELPQLLNVLRGEMSLVGPRPLPLRDYRMLADWHRKRYLVLPGITGLWQISGRSNLSFDDLVRLDFYYLENWSIWLDISILAKTLPAVVSQRGAY